MTSPNSRDNGSSSSPSNEASAGMRNPPAAPDGPQAPAGRHAHAEKGTDTVTTSPWLILGLSLVGISFAAPLVKLSNSSALVIATWRLGLSLVIVAVPLFVGSRTRELTGISRSTGFLTVAAGVLLALHFWTWNQSLQFTSVAASVSLVNLQPVIVALVSARWLSERPSRKQWTGIMIGVLGALIVAASDMPWTTAVGASAAGAADTTANASAGSSREIGFVTRALIGDLLALVGAAAGAGYYLLGRRVRQSVSLWPYVTLVYGAAFVTCLLMSAVSGEALWPQPPREVAIFAGLAVGPMLFGHTGINWALGHLPAYVVNLTTLGEPIGATILAAALPGIGEMPGVGTVIGGVLVLLGVVVAARK